MPQIQDSTQYGGRQAFQLDALTELLSPNDTAHIVSGPPLIIPKHHRGITAATVLLLLVMQWRRMIVLKCSTRSDNGLCLRDTIVPVLNVTSGVFWLELDDKALFDSYEVLQKDILCEVFSQKCSAAWQEARRERLTEGVMLLGRQNLGD